ncbi:MAG: hypothetical protein ACQCN5_03300 [Candidatus Bathyarchaeia archaeon]
MGWIIEASNLLFSNSSSAWVILVYYVGLTFIIGSIIWLALFVLPPLLQNILGTKNSQTSPVQPSQQQVQPVPEPKAPVIYVKKEPESQSPVQVQWVPVRQQALVDEGETESEKLRREYRNRGF